MIVRSLDTLPADKTISGDTWTSHRLLLAGDGVGFSMHVTVLGAGTSTDMWYKNHIEAVYCVRGTGSITDHAKGTTHPIQPGTIYVLNEADKHTLVATEELEVVCVFNPPVVGPETHDEDGAYPLLDAK